MDFKDWVNIITPEKLDELKLDPNFTFCFTYLLKYFKISQQTMEKVLKFHNYEVERLTKNKRLTTEEWVKRALEKRGDFYDYNKVMYVTNNQKIEIICPLHGSFFQAPNSHLDRGDGCPKCGKKSSADKNVTPLKVFVEKSRNYHGDKYDYSLVEQFSRSSEKITIICPVHGKFRQSARSHMRGHECETCSYEKRGMDHSISKEELEGRLKTLNNGLIYDLSNYKNSASIISYNCEIHGLVKQRVSKHLRGGNCSKCNKRNTWNTKTTEQFIEDAKRVHGDKYDYSKVVYKNNRHNVEILCKYHGSFFQRPNTHIEGSAGCPICAVITSNIKDHKNLEESKLMDCSLYIMKFNLDSENFYKIGLSRYVNKRILGIKHDSGKIYNPELIYEYKDSLFNIADIEHKLHKKYKPFQYFPKFYFKGHTECFNINLPIEEVIAYLSSLTSS